VLGLFGDGQLRAHWRIASSAARSIDEYGIVLLSLLRSRDFDPRQVASVSIASVVPGLTGVLSEACHRYLSIEAVVIDARSPLPIRLDVDEPLTVGADRIVNTLAASRLYRTDTLVVDLGTATTFDCITADGTFIGGVISPGVRTGIERLSERTAKLPRIELSVPARVIGRRTEDCLRSGAFYGAVDAIDGMVVRIRQEWQRPDAVAVATGGLAPVIAPYCRTVAFVEPFLTLYGIRFAREHLDEHGGGEVVLTG
jgi:type III pantothenate kinase